MLRTLLFRPNILIGQYIVEYSSLAFVFATGLQVALDLNDLLFKRLPTISTPSRQHQVTIRPTSCISIRLIVCGLSNRTAHRGIPLNIGSNHANCLNLCPFSLTSIQALCHHGAKFSSCRSPYGFANAYCEIMSPARAEYASIRFTHCPVPFNASKRAVNWEMTDCTVGSRRCTDCFEREGAMALRRTRCRSCEMVASVEVALPNMRATRGYRSVLRTEAPT